MERLRQELRFPVDDYLVEQRNGSRLGGSLPERATLSDFYDWAKRELRDDVLDALLSCMFAHTVLPSPSLELELVKTRWCEWQDSELAHWSEHRQQRHTDSLTHSHAR